MQIRNLSELTEQEMKRLMQRGEFAKSQILEAVELIENARRQGLAGVAKKVPLQAKITNVDSRVMESTYKRIFSMAKCQAQQILSAQSFNYGSGRHSILDTLTRVEHFPYERVGAYVPCGLPSTLLTIGANAKAAGVREVVVATKPDKDKGLSQAFMAAAMIARISELYTVDSAKLAIPALGFGTDVMKRVDKIAGPCSPFVDVVKQLMPLYGVAVDMRANSSELIVIADYNERQVAADLLAQAEHHLKSESADQKKFIALVPNAGFAEKLYAQIQKQASSLPEHIGQSLLQLGDIFVAPFGQAIKFSNDYYPEVLELWISDEQQSTRVLNELKCGKIYDKTPAVVGDYGLVGSGCNDPTGGTKMPGINVLTYMNRREINMVTQAGLTEVAYKAASFAQLEGLVAHAASVKP